MGHKYTKAEMLDGALAAALDDGLSQLTFGRLAKRLGTSDRVIVYYFPTKDDLIGEVIMAMGLRLQETLGAAFNEVAADHLDLLRVAWPVLTTDEADRVFALFFEANGLAVVGREPYATLIPALVEAWIVWASEFVEGAEQERRTEAETAIAVIDGLLLLRKLVGDEAGNRAAQRLGVV